MRPIVCSVIIIRVDGLNSIDIDYIVTPIVIFIHRPSVI